MLYLLHSGVPWSELGRQLSARTETLHPEMHFHLLDDGRTEPTDGVCECYGVKLIRYEDVPELHEERSSGGVRGLARAYAAWRRSCRL